MKLLNDTEDWLYEEGDNETKSVYNKQLEELKKHGDQIVKRVKEFEGRSAAFDHLGGVVVRYDKKLTQYKEENEELAHIPAEEMQKVEEAVLNIRSSSGCMSNFRSLRTFIKVPALL